MEQTAGEPIMERGSFFSAERRKRGAVMADIQKVYDFLDQAGVFFLATEEGDRPKCRPLGFKMMDHQTLYFGIGTHKQVYSQLHKNPKCEICACVKDHFLRWYGEAVFETDPAYAEKALQVMPELKKIYNKETGFHMGVFHLVHGSAAFCDMPGHPIDIVKI